MSSLRKKVSSYFRQLSFHNEPREKRHFINENTFVNKYLTGEISLKDSPPVLHGKTPNDLPNFEVGGYATGASSIVGCATGPQGGLTSVKRTEKHLSIPDVDDIDFIDKPDDVVVEKSVKNPMEMVQKIRVAGQTYIVAGNMEKTQNRKSLSLGSLTDEQIETKTNVNTNNNNNEKSEICCGDMSPKETSTIDGVSTSGEQNYPLSKSKSAGCVNKKKGKIIRLTQRPGPGPGQQVAYQNSSKTGAPEKWDKKTDYVYGLSDSLYDINQVTKERNGNPIADCFGVIARPDSAILGLADGVNWGEKAAIAAKSAVHGSLHYINKTVFDDTSLFNFEIDSLNENAPINTEFAITAGSGGNPVTNTNDVFICLLRAFNSAHNLILENGGMLTTLTVAVVLPLKNLKKDRTETYICCVCNLGDTFAYVYSPKCGVREITKGSHDVTSNRDMRDALGALGPVDGINPELNNLTLSATTLEAGDIILVASDGLTDNYDPSVCKFTVNQTVYDAPKHKATNINPQNSQKLANRPPISKSHANRASLIQAQNHLIHAQNSASSHKASNINNTPVKPANTNVRTSRDFKWQQDGRSAPLSKSSSTSRVLKTKKNEETPPRMAFLRSKTSVDLGAKSDLGAKVGAKAQIKRNEEGLPFVNPAQKYDLTLLLMEDILVRGLTGREAPCVTARILCENLLRYTISITAAKRRTLEDKTLYYDVKNDVHVEVSAREKKLRRKKCLEKIQNLPGKLDHVTVVAYNVGNRAWRPSAGAT